MYNVHCSVCYLAMHFTAYDVLRTLYSVHSIMYNVHCTLYKEGFTICTQRIMDFINYNSMFLKQKKNSELYIKYKVDLLSEISLKIIIKVAIVKCIMYIV